MDRKVFWSFLDCENFEILGGNLNDFHERFSEFELKFERFLMSGEGEISDESSIKN